MNRGGEPELDSASALAAFHSNFALKPDVRRSELGRQNQ